jgi:N-acetylglucosaminyldiphosphoundecaprenol N-acetyl-beta-D-mannosaminyltransferase
VQIVGGYSPPFRELDPEEVDGIAGDINASNADIVWVGIGVPKQEKWMAAMRPRLSARARRRRAAFGVPRPDW